MKLSFSLISIFLIAALGFAVYGNSLNGKFLWDDRYLIRDNTYLRSWSNLPKIFTGDIGAGAGTRFTFYRPVQIFTYMLDYSLWEVNVRGYHLSNIIFHILVATAAYWLINLLFRDNLLSAATCLLFVVHPVHAGVVSYMSGRADSLAALFGILCSILYIKYLQKNTRVAYILTLLCLAGALLSKESGIVLPVILLFYHYILKVRIKYRIFLPVLIIPILYIMLRMTVLKFIMHDMLRDTTFPERLPGFFVAITEYIKLLLIPFNLHVEYGNKLFQALDVRVLIGALILFLSLALAFRYRKRNVSISFGLLWFFIALVPVSNLYPVNAFMAEHWLYFPSLGLLLVLAKVFTYFYRERGGRIVSSVVFSLLVFYYSSVTIAQNNYWKEPVQFYERTLKFSPESSKTLNNLANEYADMGLSDKAIPLYEKAIEADPKSYDVYFNFGNIYKNMGAYKKSIPLYQKTIALNPGHYQAYNNLGVAYYQTGRYAKAVESYKNAARLIPSDGGIYFNLGRTYEKAGDKQKAADAFRKASSLGYKIQK